MKRIILFVCVVGLVAGCGTAKTPRAEVPTGTRYYLTWAKQKSTSVPHFYGNISLEEAQTRETYYEVTYDSAGKLTNVRKYYKGGLLQDTEYVYDNQGGVTETTRRP